jgi:ribonuclease HII
VKTNDGLSEKILLCGIDEAGRGPLAGPVYAAAVILGENFPLAILNDSKKLHAAKREAASRIIREQALCWGIGRASHTEIDEINILRASLLAMKRAFEKMTEKFAGGTAAVNVIVDGIYTPDIAAPCEAIIKADGKVHAVMAASILAKTERDAEMARLAKLYPEYHYEKHKGYPTKQHKQLLAEFGPSPIQRRSFKY